MSLADRDRLVFEEYADLDRHLAGVWRRERMRSLACRWGWCVLAGFARAGLSMIGISPYEVQSVGSRAGVGAVGAAYGSGFHCDAGPDPDVDLGGDSGCIADSRNDVRARPAADSPAEPRTREGDR